MPLPKNLRWTWIACAVVVEGALLAGAFQMGTRYGMYNFYRSADSMMMEAADAPMNLQGPTTAKAAATMQNQSFVLRGEVTDITENVITLTAKDGSEQIILLQPDTRIRGRANLAPDIAIGDIIFVVGAPMDDGMHARAIAILGRVSEAQDMTDESFEDEEMY